MVGIGGRISRMTRESTSLASRETTREQWAHYLAFVRKHGTQDAIQRCLGQCLCHAEPAHQLH